jgi:hypothetical protein
MRILTSGRGWEDNIKKVLIKLEVRGLYSSVSGKDSVTGFYEDDNEASGSNKSMGLFD